MRTVYSRAAAAASPYDYPSVSNSSHNICNCVGGGGGGGEWKSCKGRKKCGVNNERYHGNISFSPENHYNADNLTSIFLIASLVVLERIGRLPYFRKLLFFWMGPAARWF